MVLATFLSLTALESCAQACDGDSSIRQAQQYPTARCIMVPQSGTKFRGIERILRRDADVHISAGMDIPLHQKVLICSDLNHPGRVQKHVRLAWNPADADQRIRQSVCTRRFLLFIAGILIYSVTFNGIISHLATLLSDRVSC